IMWAKKQYHSLAKQIVSLQIIWTVVSVITVFLTAIIRNAFWLPDDLVPISMLIMLLANVFIILRNAAAIDKQKQLAIRLNFNVI
ncbi:MAG: DNA-binding protein, partial [Bacteroidota bacterium]